MNRKKLLTLILSLLMLASPLASCTSTSDPDSPENGVNEISGEAAEKPQILTNVFRGTQLSLPEDYTVNSNIIPVYDTEKDEMTCFCTFYQEILDEEGNYSDYIQEKHIVTIASDGTIVSDKKLEIEGEENNYINNGVFTEDSFIYLSNSYDPDTDSETFCLVKYNLADGTHTKSDSLQPLFAETDQTRPWFYINYMAVDTDGYVYLGAESEVLVLDPGFIKSFSVISSSWIDGLTASPDGKVYTYGYFDTGRGLCPIDKATKSLGAPIEYEGPSNLRNIYFGEGYDMYFNDDNGLYGLNLTDGSYEMVMSYQNSDTTEDNLEIMRVLNPESFIASERDPVTYETYLSVYKKAEDIDLSSVNVIEIASPFGLDYQVPAMVVDFNKNNPGTRIVVTDYSVYNSDEDWQAGMTKLTTDILNGLYKPDVVFGSTDSDLMKQLVTHDLYTDLYTFIDKDDRVRREDIFGAVKKLYETEDGKMWGIGPEFEVRSIIGPKSLLGSRESWTFTEMLDFAQSLPAGVELMENITRTSAPNYLLGNTGYAAFIDQENASCSFNSPEFIRYLEFIKDLPAEIDYSNRPDDYWQTSYLRRHNGEVALSNANLYSPGEWVGFETQFNTKDYTLIGYPVSEEGEYGSVASAYSTYIITSFCEFPEEAWSFIKDIIAPEFDEMRGMLRGIHSFPILKSLYDITVEDYYTYEFEFYFSGGASWGSYDPEHPSTEELQEPGIRTYFTEADGAALKEFLDKKVSAPSLTEAVDEEIISIINEEISTYASGMRDAKGCADIIQSRVSIWLAEHE